MFKLKDQKAFSLVEVLISVFIIMTLTVGIYSLIILSFKLTYDNKMYVQAIEIANQRMEQIRNLPYTEVGTQFGSPVGSIPDNETVNRDGIFNLLTQIRYHDDPFDGTFGDGDAIWDDYKIATVNVSWVGKYRSQNITLTTKVIPNTQETHSGNGLLHIIVIDSNGARVPDADIRLLNVISGAPDLTLSSDSNGELIYSVPPGFEAYYVRVSKDGYSVDQTYERNLSNPNPTKPHISVVVSERTEESFCIDRLSTMRVHTINANLPQNWQANTNANASLQTNGQMIIDNAGNVYLVWQDSRNGHFKVMGQKYNMTADPQWPNSASPEDVFISTANNTIVPDIKIDSMGNLYVAWHDDSTGNKEAYLRRFDNADGSPSWGGAKKVNTLADSKDQTYPRITVRDNGIRATTSLVFVDDRNNDLDIFLQVFDHNSNYMISPEKRLSTTVIGDGSNQYEAEIVNDASGMLYVAWTDDRNFNLDVFLAKYDEFGNSYWEITAAVDNPALDQYEAALAMDSAGYIYVIWTEMGPIDSDIRMQKYDSNGIAQWPADIRVNTDAYIVNQSQPALAIDSSDNIYIVWTDERNGNKDIFAQKYDSGGNSLWTHDLRINIGTDIADQYRPDIAINPVNNTPYAAWIDERNGSLDIYATAFDYYAETVPVGNLGITVHGSKRIGDPPPNIIYKYDISTTTNASGFVDLLAEWDVPGYHFDLSAASSYTLMMTEPSMPVPVLADDHVNVYMYVQ